MFCGKCGTKIPEGGRFCPVCGMKIEEDVTPVDRTPDMPDSWGIYPDEEPIIPADPIRVKPEIPEETEKSLFYNPGDL